MRAHETAKDLIYLIDSMDEVPEIHVEDGVVIEVFPEDIEETENGS